MRDDTMITPLMAPDLTARVTAGALSLDDAAAAFRKGKARPLGWPLPPGSRPWQNHAVVGGYYVLEGTGEQEERRAQVRRPPLDTAAILAATQPGDKLSDIARRMGEPLWRLEVARYADPVASAAIEEKRGGYQGGQAYKVTDDKLVSLVQSGDTIGDIARRAGLSRERLRARMKADERLNAEIDRRMGW